MGIWKYREIQGIFYSWLLREEELRHIQ